MCNEAPDTRLAQQAAVDNAQISKDALEWFKQTYTDGAPDRAAASQAAREQAGLQADLARQSLSTQADERNRYKNTFQPVENRIVSDAMGYDTPGRREAAAGQAMADVGSQFALSGDAAARDAAARGVDPSSGNFAATLARQAISEAAAKAAAGNTARDRVETVGNARLMDAAGLGRGVVSNQATQAQIGLSSGNSSVNNANVPNMVNQQGANLMQQGFNTGIAGNASAGQMNLGAANAQSGVDAANGQTAMGAGTAVAGIAMAI
jgi:hypothetical protein